MGVITLLLLTSCADDPEPSETFEFSEIEDAGESLDTPQTPAMARRMWERVESLRTADKKETAGVRSLHSMSGSLV